MQLGERKERRMRIPPPARRSSASKAPAKRSTGLGAIDTDAARKSLEGPHALSIVRRLQSELLKADSGKKPFVQPKRADAIRLLSALRDTVADITDDFENKSEIRISSHYTTLLDSLLGQLEDLDYGRVGDLLRPTEGVGGAAYKFEEKRIREMALVAVSCLQDRGILMIDACKQVSAVLKRKGVRFRNEEISDRRILSWWRNPPK